MNPVPDVVVEEKADVTHIRPFNKEHAMAGAPFCCANGRKISRVVLWDNPGRSPILACVGFFNEPFFWRDTGSRHGYREDPLDLVMLPLGFVQGMPVFVGDKIVSEDDGKVYMASPEHRNFIGTCWPAAEQLAQEREYPKSDITAKYVEEVTFRLSGAGVALKVEGGTFSADAMCQIIGGVAIWCAIEKGQVVLPPDDVVDAEFKPGDDDPAEVAFWNFDARKKGYAEWKGRPQSERDAFKAEFRLGVGDAVHKAIASEAFGVSREVRDMEIAQAVRSAAFMAGIGIRNFGNETMEVRDLRTSIQALDLKQIIAAVNA